VKTITLNLEYGEGWIADGVGHFNEAESPVEVVRLSEAKTIESQRDGLLKGMRDISEQVSFVGCEGPGDWICVDSPSPREDWCPMCRIGEIVRFALTGERKP
jgi:hypothetical protein